MHLGYFGGVLGQDKDEVHGIGSRDGMRLDLFEGIGLVDVFRRAFEDRFETGGILELFVGMGVLMRL